VAHEQLQAAQAFLLLFVVLLFVVVVEEHSCASVMHSSSMVANCRTPSSAPGSAVAPNEDTGEAATLRSDKRT
jgi:hypothetical protein